MDKFGAHSGTNNIKLLGAVNRTIIAEKDMGNTMLQHCFLHAALQSWIPLFIKELTMHHFAAVVIHDRDQVYFLPFARVTWIRDISPVIRIGLPAIVGCIMLEVTKGFFYFPTYVSWTSWTNWSNRTPRSAWTNWSYWSGRTTGRRINSIFNGYHSQWCNSSISCSNFNGFW
jgi:hypothetical protein